VYGRSAVAAALSDLRVRVACHFLPDSRVFLDLPDLSDGQGTGLCFDMPLKEFQSKFSSLEVGEEACAGATVMRSVVPSQSQLACLSQHLSGEGVKKAIKSLVFLSTAILLPVLKQLGCGLRIYVRTEGLPVGAGLGSSAALAVAASACLLRMRAVVQSALAENAPGALSLKILRTKDMELLGDGCTSAPTNPPQPLASGAARDAAVPSETWLQRINAFAFAAEVVMTGTPSGIDNTASCFGALVRYRKGSDGSANFHVVKNALPSIRFLVTNTNVPRETSVLVAGVGARRAFSTNLTHAMDSIFDAIEAINEEFLSLAMHTDEASVAKSRSHLKTLIDMNHDLLNAIGVGHSSLDTVRIIAKRANLSTKLTGAGGGGCAITLLPEDSPGSEVGDCAAHPGRLPSALQAHGFQCFHSNAGGVGVLWPRRCEGSAETHPESRMARSSSVVHRAARSAFLGAVACTALVVASRFRWLS